MATIGRLTFRQGENSFRDINHIRVMGNAGDASITVAINNACWAGHRVDVRHNQALFPSHQGVVARR
jgi:hypothetical protein